MGVAQSHSSAVARCAPMNAERIIVTDTRVHSLAHWLLRGATLVAALLAGSPARAREDFPSLERAIAQAQTLTPAAVDARGAALVAQALEVGARVSPLGNPYFEVTADRGQYTRSAQLLGTLYLPMEVQGQRGARIGEWKQFVSWKGALLEDTLARTLRDAVLAYGDVRVARARLTLAEDGEAYSRAESEAYARRLTAGDATAYDVSVAQSELSRWSQLRAAESAAFAHSLAQFAEVTGTEPLPPAATEPIEPPLLRGTLPTGSFDDWLANNSALRVLSAESRYWQANGERMKKEAWAPVSLILTGGRGDLGETRYGAGLAISIPATRRNQGEQARAASEGVRASAVRNSLRAAIGHRLRGAAEAYRIAVAGTTELDVNGIPAAERVVTNAADAQKAGKGESIRVLIARRDLAAARARRLELVHVAWSSYAELAAIKGALP